MACPKLESSTLKHLCRCVAAPLLLVMCCVAQDHTRPTERILGTVTAVDRTNHTATVKEDKTGTEYTVQLAETRTLLKVEPGAKDLKNATRITADDLAPGDRVEIGGAKTPDNPNSIAARSVILMSARELAQAHQAQTAAWQRSTPGVVTGVDTANQKLNIAARTPEGTKPVVVQAANAEFTRYSPENPKTPAASRLADIQPGDQIRVIGEWSADRSSISAQRIYSSSFRTLVGTVTSIARDEREITVKDLQTKQPVTLTLNNDSAVRRLPPMLAYALARRFNLEFRPPQGAATGGSGPGDGTAQTGRTTAGNPPGGEQGEEAARVNNRAQRAGPAAIGRGDGMRAAANGDLSQILDRLPKISVTDLKPGDAVVISGSPQSGDKSHLLATNVIAGVEPIFQSASPRQAQSLGDWGASLGGGGLDAGAGMPGGGPPQ